MRTVTENERALGGRGDVMQTVTTHEHALLVQGQHTMIRVLALREISDSRHCHKG